MVSKDLRERFKFHLKHGGWCSPPGRVACAMSAAQAEAALERGVDAGDWRVRWVPDEHFDIGNSGDDPSVRKGLETGRYDVYGCILERRVEPCGACGAGERWDVADSLWGIIIGPDGEDDYRRTVEADMAGVAGLGA